MPVVLIVSEAETLGVASSASVTGILHVAGALRRPCALQNVSSPRRLCNTPRASMACGDNPGIEEDCSGLPVSCRHGARRLIGLGFVGREFHDAARSRSSTEDLMTADFTAASPEPTEETMASRRGFVAAVTMAAVANTAGRAEAQATSNARHFNPQGMSRPAQYSHVVEVTGPNRTIYIAGQ